MSDRSHWLASSLAVLVLAACSDADHATSAAAKQANPPATKPTPAEIERANATELENALTLAGWRGIRLGEPPGGAAGDYGFTDRGGLNTSCHLWRSDGSPGMLLMVEDQGSGPVVTRITARNEHAADVHTTRGITVGSTETDVRDAYETLESEPHKYEPPPAKNLYWQPAGGSTGLRFEINAQGRVGQLHSGIEPSLRYVEGCS